MRTLLAVIACVFATPAWAQSDCWPNCPQDETYRDSIWSGSPPWAFDGEGDPYQAPMAPRVYLEPQIAQPPPIIRQMPTISDPKPCGNSDRLSSCY